MKIAMLGAKAVPTIGGVAGYTEELGTRLAARGHDVTVYCRAHFLETEPSDYRGMHRVVTGGMRGKHLDAATHTLTSALHALRSDYDVLHIHGAAPGMVAPMLQFKPRGMVITTLHGLDWTGSKWGAAASGLMYAAARFGIMGADRVTAVSQWVKEECRRRLRCEAEYIPTGVNFPRLIGAEPLSEWGLHPGEYLFCASRLVPEKGVHYLVEAYAGLKTDKPLVIAGSCPYEDPYVARLREQANDRVIFAGYVKGEPLAALYSNAYVYVQPSESEGLPLSVLEALSYGRCVLASDIPQNKEALGPCGHTFATRDADSLRRQLAYLLNRPDVVGAEFSRGREYIRRERNWDVTADRFEELYQTLLVGRRPRMIAAPA
jgi:glycosyltransferase involved in cell wall biosynthesis